MHMSLDPEAPNLLFSALTSDCEIVSYADTIEKKLYLMQTVKLYLIYQAQLGREVKNWRSFIFIKNDELEGRVWCHTWSTFLLSLWQVLSLLLRYRNGITQGKKNLTTDKSKEEEKDEGLLTGDYQEIWTKHMNNMK